MKKEENLILMRKIKLVNYILIITFLFSQIAFADTIYFYHTDPAGTPIAMTDASGSVVWKADYKPFGEEWNVTANIENNKRFVGKEKDTETGLNYFGARYMSSNIGRFISTDSVGPVNPVTGKINQKLFLDPQRLNLYAYGLNNPYRFLDSDGKWPEEVHNKIIDAAFPKLSKKLIKQMKAGSVHVDKDQAGASSYKHAMRAGGTPEQTVEDAKKEMNSFIMQKLKEYRDLMAQNKEKEAYFALGEAMHPLMDSTSPSHIGFQVWEEISDIETAKKAYIHGQWETVDVFESNPAFLKTTVDLLRKFNDTFK